MAIQSQKKWLKKFKYDSNIRQIGAIILNSQIYIFTVIGWANSWLIAQAESKPLKCTGFDKFMDRKNEY